MTGELLRTPEEILDDFARRLKRVLRISAYKKYMEAWTSVKAQLAKVQKARLGRPELDKEVLEEMVDVLMEFRTFDHNDKLLTFSPQGAAQKLLRLGYRKAYFPNIEEAIKQTIKDDADRCAEYIKTAMKEERDRIIKEIEAFDNKHTVSFVLQALKEGK